jgi:putative transposase
MSRPRRIEGFSYRGPARYFLTFCTRSRKRAFEDPTNIAQSLEQIRRTAAEEAMAILVYCFMPDHLHLLIEGSTATADLRRFVKLAKQRSGAMYALQQRKPLWQEGYYERVLRAEDDARQIARYILSNPVRGSFVENPMDYAHMGSDVWELRDLLESLGLRLPGPKGPGLQLTRAGSERTRPTTCHL